MSTSTSIDHGDYVEVLEGEPTWQNPTVWGSRRVDWKPGTAPANEKSLRDGIAASITALKADIDQANLDIAATNATINANPATFIKNLERALKNTDRAVLRLLKIASAAYSDTDLGAA